jgi:hypothetical protein
VSHVYYPQMAALVKSFCLDNGLPYRSYSWDKVIWKCLVMLRTPSEVETDVDAFRVSLQQEHEESV